jgi:hypothetical protein
MRLRLTISGGTSYVNNVRRGKLLGQQEEVAYEAQWHAVGALQTYLRSPPNCVKHQENQQLTQWGDFYISKVIYHTNNICY